MPNYVNVTPGELRPGHRIVQPSADPLIVESVADGPGDGRFGPQVAVTVKGGGDPLLLPRDLEGGIRVEAPDGQ